MAIDLNDFEYRVDNQGNVELLGFKPDGAVNIKARELKKIFTMPIGRGDGFLIPNSADFAKAGVIEPGKQAYITGVNFAWLTHEADQANKKDVLMVPEKMSNDSLRAFRISNTDNEKLSITGSFEGDKPFLTFNSDETREYEPFYFDFIDLKNLDVSQVENMSYAFKNVFAHSLDLSTWDVSNVKNMQGMFAVDFPTIKPGHFTKRINLSNWNTHNVEDMSNMFKGQAYLDDIKGIENLDTANVKDMAKMFMGTKDLNMDLDLTGWDVSNLENVSYMFENTGLQSLDLSGWQIDHIKDTSDMFSKNGWDFHSLKKVDLGGWDTSQVQNMARMFEGQVDLEKIDGLENWDVSNVKNMLSMFKETPKLKADLSRWEAPNATTFEMVAHSAVKNAPTLASRGVRQRKNLAPTRSSHRR